MPLILGCALLGLAWLLPGHYLPWMMFQQEACAAMGGLLLCLAVAQSRAPIHWPRAALAMAALALMPWAQLGAGLITFRADAALASAYLLGLALSISVGASLGSGRLAGQLLEGLSATFVLAALLSLGMALHQYLGLPPLSGWLEQLPPGSRPFANLGQPNHLYSVLALGMAGVLRWYELRRLGPWACALALFVLGWGIAMTQSRTGWIFIAILAAGYWLLRPRLQLRAPRFVVLAGAAAFTAMVLAQSPFQGWWFDPFEDATAPLALRTEAGTRLLHWKTLSDAALQAPWFGYGWNQVAHAQFDFAGRHAASGENVMHSHNLALDLALYNGIPLAALLLLGLLAWVVRACAGCRDGASAALIAALLALLIHAALEYPLHYTYFLLPAGLVVGVLSVRGATAPASAHSGSHPPHFGRGAPRATLWLPTCLLALALAWISVEYLRAEEALRRLRFATARISLTFADLRSPEVVLIDGWKAYHDASLLRPRTGMPADELELLKRVARRYPYAPALQRLAQALALNGQPERARLVLVLVCKMFPPRIQEIVRDAWQQEQLKTAPTLRVPFPSCVE